MVNILKIISAEYKIDISVIDLEDHSFSFDENYDYTSIVETNILTEERNRTNNISSISLAIIPRSLKFLKL
jgi:hypothetical protein